MENSEHSEPSFSRGQRWSIGLNTFLAVLAVLALVVMANLSGCRILQTLPMVA